MTPETLDRYSTGTSGAAPALRTLRATEILDEALRTYRLLAPILLRRSAVPAVFVLASALFWTRVFWPRLMTTSTPGNAAAQVGEAGFVLAVGILVAGPLLIFGLAEATLQCVAVTTAFREGRWRGEAAAAAEARRAFPRTLGAGLWTFLVAGTAPLLAFGAMAGAGLVAAATSEQDGRAGVLAVLGGVGMLIGLPVALWCVAAYALAPAAALRGEGARAACRRSRRLMGGVGRVPGGYGTVWAVYGILAVSALAEWMGFQMVLEYVPFARLAPGGGLFAEALSLATPFVVAWTLLPFWGAAVAVIDGERRVRKEGYDVELLAKA